MSKDITESTPRLTVADIAPEREGEVRQRVQIADKYQKVQGRLVRYRVTMDTAYLAQSTIVADVWTGRGWAELVNLHAEVEFYVVQGPDRAASDPGTRELSRPFRAKDLPRAVRSWQKVYALLGEEVERVLGAIG